VTKRRKPGRPSLGVSARTRRVTVLLSDVEYKAVAARVARENAELKRDGAEGEDKHPTTISSWFRDHGLDPLGLMPRSSED
jgi:hypothetical protein